MLPAREPLTLQTTLATISFCSSSFPSSSSSSPSFLAASRKPKCCRYGLGPSCSSGSLPSHSSSSSLLALSLSVHLFPSCTTFCCCYAPWNWFISVLRQMQSTKFQKKENKKKTWKLFIPPTLGLEAVWAWPAASWLPSSCCCCCCYCWQFVSLILMLSNYIARAQGLDSGQESTAQVETRASAPAAATRPSH